MEEISFMNRLCLFVFIFTALANSAFPQSKVGIGEQPQITVDSKETVRLVYGHASKIYFSTSTDKGRTFSEPNMIGEVNEMHLGMTRGPQLATSKDYSVVTAMDKKGNIHAFRLTHRTGRLEKIGNVNDIDGSAPEGLMAVAADDSNNFYAVWLDVREGRKNNICLATLKGRSGWSQNRFVYKSPEGSVCECCKPSIAVKGRNVSIMFRNWLKGSRDLYIVSSSDGGKEFSPAQKLGLGTWPLKGCPMDGGGLSIDSRNSIHTAWQRAGTVYHAQPGRPEEKLGDGRNVGMSGQLVTWDNGSVMKLRRINGEAKEIGEGTALKVYEFPDASVLAVWEKDKTIMLKTLSGI